MDVVRAAHREVPWLTIGEVIRGKAREREDRDAVAFDDGQRLTYAALDARSDWLSHAEGLPHRPDLTSRLRVGSGRWGASARCRDRDRGADVGIPRLRPAGSRPPTAPHGRGVAQ